MENLPDPRDRRELDALLTAFCDGRLGKSDQSRLASILEEDPEARRYYLLYLDLHMEMSRRNEVAKIIPLSTGTQSPNRRSRHWLTAGLAVAAAIAVAGVTFWNMDESPPENMKTSPGELRPKSIAYVTKADGIEWNQSAVARPGLRVSSGDFEISSGRLRLDFFDGTAVTVAAPAEFTIHSETELSADSGQFAIRTAEPAAGFIVSTPDAEFVDVGTEFALNVNGSQKSQLFVREGEVVATVFSPDGAPLEERAAIGGQRLDVDASSGITEADRDDSLFVKMLEPSPFSLPVSEAYVRSILREKPIGYWRFEKVDGDLVRNETGDHHHALVLGDVSSEGDDKNKAIRFDADDSARGLFVEKPFGGFPAKAEYSVELWVNPQNDLSGGLVSLVEVDAKDLDQALVKPPSYRMMAIECTAVDPKHWSREPAGKIGFFHRSRTKFGNRSRYGENKRGSSKSKYRRGSDDRKSSDRRRGYSHGRHRHESEEWHGRGRRDHESRVYSKIDYAPGSWHHVVAVRKATEILLYVDGELESTAGVSPNSEPGNLRMILGRYSLAPGSFGKALTGLIDEVALYDYALTAEQISSHFRLVDRSAL